MAPILIDQWLKDVREELSQAGDNSKHAELLALAKELVDRVNRTEGSVGHRVCFDDLNGVGDTGLPKQ